MLSVAFQDCAENSGSLFIDSARMRNFTRVIPNSIHLTTCHSPHRRDVERLVEQTFANSYKSRITRHYPFLLSVHDNEQNVLAAVGFRLAATGPLFLEQYLPGSVEDAINVVSRAKVQRSQVVEIGSLASSGRGASIFLFVALAAYLHQQGFTFAVATATETLRKAFKFLRFDLSELAIADRSALTDGGDAWGSYYDSDPVVVGCPISQGFGRLERFLPAAQNKQLTSLLSQRIAVAAEEGCIQ